MKEKRLYVVVRVRFAGKNGQSRSFRRNFVHLPVATVVELLNSRDLKKGGLPNDLTTCIPYYLNGREVNPLSREELKAGDTFAADCVK